MVIWSPAKGTRITGPILHITGSVSARGKVGLSNFSACSTLANQTLLDSLSRILVLLRGVNLVKRVSHTFEVRGSLG